MVIVIVVLFFGRRMYGDISCDNNSEIIQIDTYTNLGMSYANTTGLGGQTVFTGQRKFVAKEIEVYMME